MIPPLLHSVLGAGTFFFVPLTITLNPSSSACPGAHIALSTVWVTAASILSTFNILKPLDDYGTAIEPTMEYNSNLVLYVLSLIQVMSLLTFFFFFFWFGRQPKLFKCRFQPRHEGVELLIRSNMDIS